MGIQMDAIAHRMAGAAPKYHRREMGGRHQGKPASAAFACPRRLRHSEAMCFLFAAGPKGPLFQAGVPCF